MATYISQLNFTGYLQIIGEKIAVAMHPLKYP